MIENKINDKVYVGQTKYPSRRASQHLRLKTPGCPLLKKAVEKYDAVSFEFVLLEKCETQEEANVREIYWIDKLNTLSPNGYNLTEGGGGVSGISFSEEQKQKFRARRPSEEHKRIIREAVSGEKNAF